MPRISTQSRRRLAPSQSAPSPKVALALVDEIRLVSSRGTRPKPWLDGRAGRAPNSERRPVPLGRRAPKNLPPAPFPDPQPTPSTPPERSNPPAERHFRKRAHRFLARFRPTPMVRRIDNPRSRATVELPQNGPTSYFPNPGKPEFNGVGPPFRPGRRHPPGRQFPGRHPDDRRLPRPARRPLRSGRHDLHDDPLHHLGGALDLPGAHGLGRRSSPPGDQADVLVAFYQHSYESHINSLRAGGILIYDTDHVKPNRRGPALHLDRRADHLGHGRGGRRRRPRTRARTSSSSA